MKNELIFRSTFFTNYERNIQNIQPSSCWSYESLLTKNECDMEPFFDGIESTRKYVEERFRYEPDTRLVHISNTETVSIDSIPNIPTEEGCKQVVLGTFELIAPYFYYNKLISNKFILLAAEHWTEKLNQKYVSCAFNMLLHNNSCDFPVRVLLPNDVQRLLKANKSPRATLFELCIILQQSKRFEVYEYPLEGMDYGLYFMKHIPGKGGKRRQTQRRRRTRRTKRR